MLPNLGNSWTGSGGYIDQAKVFLGALGRNFVDEFKNGGCVAFFGDSLAAGAMGGPSPAGPQSEDVVRAAGQGLAFAYAATNALTAPLRSSVYRGILSGAEATAGTFAIGAADVSLGQAFIDEMSALRSGVCK